jgi:hypothetical protein
MQQVKPAAEAPRGYWVEPFIEIIRGVKEVSKETFQQYAETLYHHRVNGNSLSGDITNVEERKKSIEGFYQAYVALTGQLDLTERASLLAKGFMKDISKCDPCPLTKVQKEWVTSTSLPGALRAVNGLDLLRTPLVEDWLIDYRLACSTPAVIAPQTDLYEELSETDKSDLTTQRGSIGVFWYLEFKKGTISREDIVNYFDKIKKHSENPKESLPKLSNYMMENVFNKNVELANKYFKENPRGYKAFWVASIVALDTFLKNTP